MQSHDSSLAGDGAGDTPRTPAELRQHAVLDALGLLDEVDAAHFDRAFRAAPPALQAELRQIQAEAAADPALLSAEEPADDQKVRTLAAVMTAVEMQEVRFAPIAQIGRGPAPALRRPVRSIDANDLVEQAMALATANRDVERFARSAYYWRAAAIALIAALVVVLWFERQTTQSAVRLSELVVSNAGSQEVFDLLRMPSARTQAEQGDVVRGMRAIASDGTGSATLLADSRAGSAMVMTIGLRAGETYSIRVTRDDGRRETIGTFTPQQRVACIPLDRPSVPMLASAVIEIVDSRGRVVLST
ncbi:MAG: hypothetical protein U0625_07240 [Phycisphaerales bacterium]